MSDRTTPAITPKPRPIPTPVSQPYWDALSVERIVIPRCDACGESFFYARERCPHCLSDEVSWFEVDGGGTLFTFTVATVPTAPMFADEVPQLIAMIDLDEGVRLTATIVDADPADLRVGARVAPVFDHGDDGRTVLRFRLDD
ncbi:MAG: Zn-ribbon domain-containing OB-fold protein [Acidimicrobiia bacterium]|nr:Zn-ribbon domain-containing OB-fold protein [Acidimicrobiia bacterium]